MVKKLGPVTWVSRLTTIMVYDLNFSSSGSCKLRATDCYLKAVGSLELVFVPWVFIQQPVTS